MEIKDAPIYFDRKGVPIPFEEWCRLFSDFSYCSVGLTELGEDRGRVSTLWFGTMHEDDKTKPVFESIAFIPGTDQEAWTVRYTNEEAAIKGHESMVERATQFVESEGKLK